MFVRLLVRLVVCLFVRSFDCSFVGLFACVLGGVSVLRVCLFRASLHLLA